MEDTREIKTKSEYSSLMTASKIPVSGTEDDIASRRFESGVGPREVFKITIKHLNKGPYFRPIMHFLSPK